jgi:hypothetical protein
MTTKPMISIDGVLREMNAKELEQFELDKTEIETQLAEQDAKIAARESALQKLAALGLTEEEIAAL